MRRPLTSTLPSPDPYGITRMGQLLSLCRVKADLCEGQLRDMAMFVALGAAPASEQRSPLGSEKVFPDCWCTSLGLRGGNWQDTGWRAA